MLSDVSSEIIVLSEVMSLFSSVICGTGRAEAAVDVFSRRIPLKLPLFTVVTVTDSVLS